MKEQEMEDLLWAHPEKLLIEPLKQFRRQPSSGIGRADLVFKDKHGGILVIEVKRGILQRGAAIDQLLDYFGMLKNEFPDSSVELMVVANEIPRERRLACERHNIEWREISEKKFRDVASEVGYVIQSEQIQPVEPVDMSKPQPVPSRPPVEGKAKGLARSGMARYDANGGMSPERKRRRALREALSARGLKVGADLIDPLIMAGLSDDEIIRRLSTV
jgi:hypothetical protein